MAQQSRAGARTSTPPSAQTEAPPSEQDKPLSTDDRLTELEARVEWLEEHLRVPPRETAEADQEAKDRETLSRQPNSYEEAVEFEAAQRRQSERGVVHKRSEDETKAED